MRRQERNLASPPSKLTRLPSTIDIGYGGEIAVNLIFGIGRQRCGTCLESGTAPSAESRDLPDVARASVGAPHVRGDIPTPFGRRVFFPLPPVSPSPPQVFPLVPWTSISSFATVAFVCLPSVATAGIMAATRDPQTYKTLTMEFCREQNY